MKVKTSLAEYCKNENKSFISGFEMYKHQFCAQFEHYTGIKVATEIVEEIAYNNKLV